ncbi:MAG: replication and repair protein RecF [Candidatus Saccharibacteria bacterium]|nr:replication and repair protein RecF [Candidatus Saccharibacteria bacterium]
MITDLRLQHFRSYDDSSFELSPGVNIVVGPNASGKTNLLEAVLVLARGSSYRARDAELVAFEQPWARIDADMSDGGARTVKITREPLAGKSYEISGKPYKRLNLASSLPAVLFEPNHLQLLSGSPERRRTYLDDLLEQTVGGYGLLRRQYRRALAQRNSLLKLPTHSIETQIFPWNIRLSELAGRIVRYRCQLVAQIEAELGALYKELSQTSTSVAIRYDGRWPADAYETNLLKKLESSLELDKLRGFTASGPHREDMTVLFDGRPAAETASRGEVRTAVLALKIMELKLMQTAHDGVAPLLLLDDVFSELDGKRRHALTDYLAPYQTFITTTDADLVLQNFTNGCNVIPLS